MFKNLNKFKKCKLKAKIYLISFKILIFIIKILEFNKKIIIQGFPKIIIIYTAQ